MLIKRKFRYLFVAASLLLFIPPAMAEDTPWEKFSLDLGYFIANTDTNVRALVQDWAFLSTWKTSLG